MPKGMQFQVTKVKENPFMDLLGSDNKKEHNFTYTFFCN